MKLRYRDTIAEINSILKEKYNSEQYQLSSEIIARKLKLKLSQIELANSIGLDYQVYLEMEAGSLDYSAEEYKKVLDKIDSIYV